MRLMAVAELTLLCTAMLQGTRGLVCLPEHGAEHGGVALDVEAVATVLILWQQDSIALFWGDEYCKLLAYPRTVIGVVLVVAVVLWYMSSLTWWLTRYRIISVMCAGDSTLCKAPMVCSVMIMPGIRNIGPP